jgi:polyvinyl alcohol dehydrogenase (cytochrome)
VTTLARRPPRGGAGPTIANRMVFTMSGYNGAESFGANGVKVLLAFSVDGK